MLPQFSQGFCFIALVWIVCGIASCFCKDDSPLGFALFASIGYALFFH